MDTQQEKSGAKHLATAKANLQGRTGESKAQRSSDAVKEAIKTRSAGTKSGNTPEALVKQQEQASVKGHHSGRPHPPKFVMGGDENDHASNGGTTNAVNTNKAVVSE
jgi:hypothetical protein